MARINRQNTDLARNLRNNATIAEQRLWRELSARKVAGTRFNRQVCIGPYICDFAARTPKLVIELDGGQHALEADRDEARTGFLEALGYHVMRFWNHEVMENIDGVVGVIERQLQALPQPLPQAGGETGVSTVQ